MNKRKTLITMLALVCMLVVGIGFAAITSIGLKVNGSVNLEPNSEAFKVEFTDSSRTGGSDADTVNLTAKTTAEITVSSLNTKDTSVTFTLTITNNSTDDIDAIISKPTITSETDTASAFTVTTAKGWTENTDTKLLAPTESTTITVTVTLDIAPINTVTGSFVIDFTATPQLAA